MNKQNQKKRPSIFTWIHKNRVKLGIWLFFIVLPIALVVTAYVGSYTSNKSVYFDQEITEESEKIRHFVDADELTAITLDIEWDALKRPTLTDYDELDGGYYRFNMKYTANPNFQIETVRITPVLKTDWKNFTSVGVSRVLSTNMISFAIDFNFDLPHTPLLFVSIEEPNLYIKVETTYQTAGQTVVDVEYVKFPLSDINPKIVVPD